MADELQSKVPRALKGMALADYLATRFRYHTRAEWVAEIAGGHIFVNGLSGEEKQRLQAGDRVAYRTLLHEPSVPRDIHIVYQDDSVLVAEKPALLPSHADGNFISNTFVCILRQQLKLAGFEGQLYLVHRLDREASGLMVVGKAKNVLPRLARQFDEGSVRKEYLAIVRGRVADDSFTVEGLIGRDAHSPLSIKRCLLPAGSTGAQESYTAFQVVERRQHSTLVKAMPRTGRTHQIRVHLASLGHPLCGDKLYGQSADAYLHWVASVKKDPNAAMAAAPDNPRLMLHACGLSFQHPLSGETMAFEAAMPVDMATFWHNT